MDTVRTSLPLVRCVMDALTMSPTPAVVSSKSRASTSGLSAPDSTIVVNDRVQNLGQKWGQKIR